MQINMMAFDLGEFVFADRLHDGVSCDEIRIPAVAKEAGVAKFVDEARCAIGCIEYRLQRIFLKNALGTLLSAQFLIIPGLFEPSVQPHRNIQFFLNITASLFFAHPV